MADFSSITQFHIEFAHHGFDPQVCFQLNGLYSSALPDPAVVYTDPNTFTDTTVKSTDALTAAVRSQIADQLVLPFTKCPSAPNHIHGLIQASRLSVMDHGAYHGASRRLTQKGLISALHAAKANHCNYIQIRITITWPIDPTKRFDPSRLSSFVCPDAPNTTPPPQPSVQSAAPDLHVYDASSPALGTPTQPVGPIAIDENVDPIIAAPTGPNPAKLLSLKPCVSTIPALPVAQDFWSGHP